jgi:hypothetical protein
VTAMVKDLLQGIGEQRIAVRPRKPTDIGRAILGPNETAGTTPEGGDPELKRGVVKGAIKPATTPNLYAATAGFGGGRPRPCPILPTNQLLKGLFSSGKLPAAS